VNVANHTCNPTHIEVFATHCCFAILKFSNIAFYRFFPMTLIRGIDGIFLRVGSDLNIFRSEQEFLSFWIKSKEYNASAYRQCHHGRWTIQYIASSHLFCPSLHKVFSLSHCIFCRQDRKNCAYTHIDVDIA